MICVYYFTTNHSCSGRHTNPSPFLITRFQYSRSNEPSVCIGHIVPISWISNMGSLGLLHRLFDFRPQLLVLVVGMWFGPGIWESIMFAFFTFDFVFWQSVFLFLFVFIIVSLAIIVILLVLYLLWCSNILSLTFSSVIQCPDVILDIMFLLFVACSDFNLFSVAMREVRNYPAMSTGTCFIQKIYVPSSSLLQGKYLPFPLPQFASKFFAYLWSFRWPNYIVTLPKYFSFRLPHLDIPTGSPSNEFDKNIQRTSLRLLFNHWNGYSHFRFALDLSYAFGII